MANKTNNSKIIDEKIKKVALTFGISVDSFKRIATINYIKNLGDDNLSTYSESDYEKAKKLNEGEIFN